ncbi:5-formyltetrahydrofolate cyclo-ligase [Cerasibacillus quisquiliarum]|uniref:5-formyltetrahydrofolate cyclo-ligase n=1 Tax=Cerasibacillus quisquiliarum TaxID=227865 RepID=A0A511UWT7_9BACI|nr:5-formyltetrahydrofolate cyclo-ligase [Cerasibacillus quisquiliarum]MBB5145509.1 5-formyltetrahydrofolate cyclo-ligase [Cerasibacillus quisquiliarum]GEN31096.1 hypothetical protein CQU01_13340 [Cerasibacillus quisquiliarum]
MNKVDLRDKMIEKLKQLSFSKKKEIERLLYTHLFALELWQTSNIIAVTISQSIEWDTTPIITQAWKEGKTVVIPKCIPKTKEMIFYTYKEGDQLQQTYFQLWEPIPEKAALVTHDQIDLIIVPGIVFDKKGYRIGFGGGYYDRYLVNYKNATVALIHTKQLLKQIPAEYYDIPVKQLITEKGIINPTSFNA